MKKCPLYDSKYSYLCASKNGCTGRNDCEHYQRHKESFDLYMSRIVRREFKNTYNRIVGIPPE